MSKAVFTIQIEIDGEVPNDEELANCIKTAAAAATLAEFKIKNVAILRVKTPEHFDLADSLHELARKHGVDDSALGDLIHDAQSFEGANVSNTDLKQQIEYLVGDSSTQSNLKGARSRIIKAIKEHATKGMSDCCLCGSDEFDEMIHLDREQQKVCDECWDERMR